MTAPHTRGGARNDELKRDGQGHTCGCFACDFALRDAGRGRAHNVCVGNPKPGFATESRAKSEDLTPRKLRAGTRSCRSATAVPTGCPCFSGAAGRRHRTRPAAAPASPRSIRVTRGPFASPAERNVAKIFFQDRGSGELALGKTGSNKARAYGIHADSPGAEFVGGGMEDAQQAGFAGVISDQ